MSFPFPDECTFLTDDVIASIHENPGFGQYFTDHMAVAEWSADHGWHSDRIVDYAPMTMEPSSAVYHYAQEIFEGMKAYRHADGSVWLFRPRANAERFVSSAQRMALPVIDPDDFVQACHQLVACDSRWVPTGEKEDSLYLRPFMMACENYLGVRPARSVIFTVIASPVGPYFAHGVRPVDIWISTRYSRVAPGGTGAAKCGGNYAASMVAQQEATEHSCNQVLFVDAVEKRWIEELGGMNFFMITSNDELITPELNGNILPGITRDSLLTIAPKIGLSPVERKISTDEVIKGLESGAITEMFACGTAAVINPIGALKDERGLYQPSEARYEKTVELRNYLLDIQYGRREDSYGWMHRVS